MTDSQNSDGQVSFVRWLHAQAKADTDRAMPYSAIYRWGKNIQSILGTDGKYDAEWVALELAQQGASAEDLSALVSAEAAWRVDNVVSSAEENGIPLQVPGSEEPVLPEKMQSEIESSDATVVCGYRNHRGEGCTTPAVPGAGRCGRHGGAITDPEVRRSFLLVAFAKVIDGSRIAVEALLDVAENGRSEMARVQAAKEILDRAGVQQDQHVHIHKPDEDISEDELLESLRDRLLETKSRLRLTTVDIVPSSHTGQREEPKLAITERSESDRDLDIVEAEIIEEVPVRD